MRSPTMDRGRTTSTALLVAAVACAAVVVSHIFGRFTYSLLLPAISDELVSSYTGAGFLGASYYGGYMFGVLVVTVVAARLEPITLMRTGLGLSALALGTIATAPEFSVLASGIFFAGFAGAAIWIPAPTIATALVPASRRGLVLGALTAAMGVGLLIVSQGTTVYRSAIGDDGAWRPIFGVEAAVTVVILAAALVLVRLPRAAVAAESPGGLFSVQALLRIPVWGWLVVSYTLYGLIAGSWAQFLGVAMEADGGFSAAHINNLYSLLALASVAGPLLLGRLSDRIGRDRAIAIAASMSGLASLLVVTAAEPMVSFGTLLYGAGSFSVPPLVAAAVRDHLDGRTFAAAYGLMTIIYGLSSLVAAQAAGALADAVGGFGPVYGLLAVAAGASASAALVRSRRAADDERTSPPGADLGSRARTPR